MVANLDLVFVWKNAFPATQDSSDELLGAKLYKSSKTNRLGRTINRVP